MFSIILKVCSHIARENCLPNPKFKTTHQNPELYIHSRYKALTTTLQGNKICQSEILPILQQVGQNVLIRV